MEIGEERRSGDAIDWADSRGDQIVAFEGDLSLGGRLIDVEIVEARSMTLLGRQVAIAAIK